MLNSCCIFAFNTSIFIFYRSWTLTNKFMYVSVVQMLKCYESTGAYNFTVCPYIHYSMWYTTSCDTPRNLLHLIFRLLIDISLRLFVFFMFNFWSCNVWHTNHNSTSGFVCPVTSQIMRGKVRMEASDVLLFCGCTQKAFHFAAFSHIQLYTIYIDAGRAPP